MLLYKLRRRMQEEKGFTLIELLVVILIIGILAAIALPTFLGQRYKAQDASAKSDARNAVSQVESCFTTTEDYTKCGSTDGKSTANLDLTGLDTLTSVSGASDGYTILATSKSGNTFTIKKDVNGTARSCTATQSKGACNGTSW